MSDKKVNEEVLTYKELDKASKLEKLILVMEDVQSSEGKMYNVYKGDKKMNDQGFKSEAEAQKFIDDMDMEDDEKEKMEVKS